MNFDKGETTILFILTLAKEETLVIVPQKQVKAAGEALVTPGPAPKNQVEEGSVDDEQADAAPSEKRGDLVSFVGNLGRTPLIFDKEGKARVKLSVAEHLKESPGAEKTIWHEVWASDKISEKVKARVTDGTLHQGSEVQIKGYKHQREPDENGRKRKPFIRAFVISPVR